MAFGESDFRNSGFGDLKFGELKFGDLEGHRCFDCGCMPQENLSWFSVLNISH